ncbi:MAG: flagellar basal body rod protein FlgC [Desulfovibrionales bacterium]
MDFMTAIDIGASGLTAERSFMNVISMNLANMNTTRTPEGGPYRRKGVVLEATRVESPFSKVMQDVLDSELRGVKVQQVVTDQRPPRKVYEPGHPHADEQGYVSYPDINVMEEMANMMTAMRSYEACASAISSTKTMFNKALELAR